LKKDKQYSCCQQPVPNSLEKQKWTSKGGFDLLQKPGPSVQAVEASFNANKVLGLEAFKTSFFFPGLTFHYFLSDFPLSIYFILVNHANSDLHQPMKKHVCFCGLHAR